MFWRIILNDGDIILPLDDQAVARGLYDFYVQRLGTNILNYAVIHVRYEAVSESGVTVHAEEKEFF